MSGLDGRVLRRSRRLAVVMAAAMAMAAALGPLGLRAQSPLAARVRLQPFVGTFRMMPGNTADTSKAQVWRMRSVIGDRYIELEETFQVRFRLTVGFDSTSQRFRMSLLDAGSGAFDVYDGDFDAAGALVLTNPQYWRVILTPRADGWSYRFERSLDAGTTWKVAAPGGVLTRILEE